MTTNTTTIPSNYDKNQVKIISHRNNNNNNNINNKTNHINTGNYQFYNPENTNVLATNTHNPNNIINGYLYNPNYVLGEAAAPAGEV